MEEVLIQVHKTFNRVRKESVNNDSCKQRLVILLMLHSQCNFNLKVFCSFPLSPPFIISHPETVNWGNFLLVCTSVGDFGRDLSCKRAWTLNISIRKENMYFFASKIHIIKSINQSVN